MNCEACGHDWSDHQRTVFTKEEVEQGLCDVCYNWRGPCFPWEFR